MEKDLTQEQIVEQIKKAVAEAKNLPGGVGAYIFTAMAKEPQSSNNKTFEAITDAWGKTENLGYLHLNTPQKIKIAAAVIELQKFNTHLDKEKK